MRWWSSESQEDGVGSDTGHAYLLENQGGNPSTSRGLKRALSVPTRPVKMKAGYSRRA